MRRKALYETALERRIMERLVPFSFNDVLTVYARFFSRRDMAPLMDRNACLSYAAAFTPAGEAPRFHVLGRYCVSTSTQYNFVVRLRSPLLRRLTHLTTRLDEAGLTQHWFEARVRPWEPSPDPVMRPRQLLPFLRLLGVGLAAAFAAFFAELACHAGGKGCVPLLFSD